MKENNHISISRNRCSTGVMVNDKKEEAKMDNSNVYVWRSKGVKDDVFDGDLDKPHSISLSIFNRYKSVQKAYLEWREEKGVKTALLGSNDDKEFVDECKRTVRWVEKGCFDPIGYHLYYREYLSQDVLCVSNFVPCVSQKVVDILQEVCPEEIEIFRVSLNYETDKKYYVINLTRGIRKDVFMKNGLGVIHFSRLIKGEQDDENTSKILVSEKLIKKFKEANIQGLEYLKFGENPYAF